MSLVKITAFDHIQGQEKAAIALVEYADYQCPYCRKAFYIVKDLQKKFGSNLKFIFRNYPLQELHPYAVHAALAAEAANQQGKFWEMHDIIFENQQQLDDASLITYAKKIGLNLSQFEKDFSSNTTIKKIQEDIDSGNEAGVQGTPTFFVNGHLFNGNWTDKEFPEYLESLL